MGTYYINLSFRKARVWNNKKVRTLGGSYAHALKFIYGDNYVHVDLEANNKAYWERQDNEKAASFKSELI